MKSSALTAGVVLFCLLSLTGVTQAAPIHWGPATDVFSASEVVNSGTLIEAFNAGGSTSGRDQTVNGVLFTGTSALLSQARDQDVFSRDTGDAGYNALLSSMDTGGGTDLVSLEVGGGKLSVGTEYRIQMWWAADQASRVVPVVVGDGESSANTVTLNSTPGQFTIGSFIADGNTQTITLESPDFGDTYLTAYQIRDRAISEVTAEEMKANSNRQLSKFPYSWDKVTRWAYARKGINKKWKKEEIDIMGTRCKYIWIQEDSEECNNFKKAYPNKMYCFSYINLEKVSFKPNPFEPSYFLYGKNGGTSTYSSGQMKYNQANPDCRKWWLKTITENANSSPKSDVIFIDSLQKALRIAHGDYYDSWGGRVSPGYIGKALIPLLKSVRDELSKDFIIQGNFLRAAGGYTKDGNFSYVRDYIDSAYMEGFEGKGYIHHTIEIVQKAAAQGKMIAPNFTASSKCGNIEEARKKASQAMPTFWARLEAKKPTPNGKKLRPKDQNVFNKAQKEQDALACMYSNFDFKLAYFLIMAGENSYMRISNQVLAERAGTDMFGIVPPFPEFDRKLGKPISDGVRVSATTWQRKFEYCKVTLNVDHDMADIDWSYRSDDKYGTENMALGKPATQSSTVEGGVALRAVDGNTDGDMSKGSVNQTGNGQAWWQVDLEAIREIGKIDVWNRTDAGTDSTADFYVMVSMDPFLSTDLKKTLAQPGVTAVKVDGKCATPTSLPFNIAGRYVRVQLTSTAGVMNMAEVQVWSALARKNNPPVATAQSVKTAINNALDITLSGSDVELDTLTASLDTMPSHGKVTLVGNVATYQPDKDYSGTDSFTFKVKDADFTSKATATVSIAVESLLYAHWAFDETTGSVAKDSSGYGRDASIINGKWVKGVKGGKGNALNFNGTSTTVKLPASTFASISDEITIAMWVNGGDESTKGCNIFSAQVGSGKKEGLGILLPFSSGWVYWDAGKGEKGLDRISKRAKPDQYKGAWNHWVFTKDAKTGVMSIYHNGALFTTGTGKIGAIGTITSASIGGGGKLSYNGAIDNVRVYKAALSAAEVKELYLKEK